MTKVPVISIEELQKTFEKNLENQSLRGRVIRESTLQLLSGLSLSYTSRIHEISSKSINQKDLEITRRAFSEILQHGDSLLREKDAGDFLKERFSRKFTEKELSEYPDRFWVNLSYKDFKTHFRVSIGLEKYILISRETPESL